MPPRKRTTPAVLPIEPQIEPQPPIEPQNPSPLTAGAAVRLPDGGEAIVLSLNGGKYPLLKVGTGPWSRVTRPLEGLELVAEDDETERHRRFRADALRRDEIGE